MKLLLAIIALFTAVNIQAQTSSFQEAMDAQINRQLRTQPPELGVFALQPLKANEIKVNGITYSGILVELSKTDEPLELINPFASPEYGMPEDNTARDALSGQILGWKLFALQF
jgi:hypothetical protein